MGFAYGLSEYFNWPTGFSKRPGEALGFYVFFIIEVVPAALVVLFTRKLADLVLDIMVFNSIALAIPSYLLIHVVSRKDIVGRYAIGRARALVLYIVTTV
jgi:Mn2+/Fe2+ NRAMP family transporter